MIEGYKYTFLCQSVIDCLMEKLHSFQHIIYSAMKS